VARVEGNNKGRVELKIDIVSDVVCPWCYVGKRRLELALRNRPNVKAEIRWVPYFLEARVPAEGMPRVDYIGQKFGVYQRFTPGHERLIPLGADVGIEFRFDKIYRQPNTTDAHRIIGWAQKTGRASSVVERLFSMFFVEGGDLSDREMLVAAGRAGGLDSDEMRRDLLTERDKRFIERQATAASRAGIGGVPFFVFGKKISVAGAHEVEVLTSAMDQALGIEKTPVGHFA
jgi:predicted DsbA family dithiol-disulfide isomerase